LENEIEQIKENHLRKVAEMENMRKRLQRERQQFFQVAKENAILEFLPISDDLMRTLEAMKEGEAHDAYIDVI
jgi:molecular chaperone GrpE